MAAAYPNTLTMILRFRDLATSRGITIQEHCDIIRNNGFVWWGWWSKAGETIPLDTFAYLLEKVHSPDGLKVFLFDSGSYDVHIATCRDIQWDKAKARIMPPDPDKTPGYYRNNDYLAWFKFDSIESCPNPAVGTGHLVFGEWSYVRENAFFEDGESRYMQFYGKVVSDAEELCLQNRTIWFVRKKEANDPTQKISLLESNKIEPVHFAEHFQQPRSFRLLWLSDLHFSEDANHHMFPLDPSAAREPLGIRLTRALDSLQLQRVGGVLVTGDLTWQAKPEEFTRANEFFAWLSSSLKLNSHQFAVCPGNHDLAFSGNPSNKGLVVENASEQAIEAFGQFYQKMFYLRPNEHLTSGRRILLGGSIPIEIIALNSSHLQQQKGFFQGHGFLGEQQLEYAVEKMQWSETDPDKPVPIRVALLHHHILPVTYCEEPEPSDQRTYSSVLDGEMFSRWIVKNRVKLVLHGHMHQPFWAQIERSRSLNPADQSFRHAFHVLGMGSTGAAQAHLGEIGTNTFAILDFGHDSVKVTFYSIHPTNEPREVYGPFELDLTRAAKKTHN